jgi:hypothetical protein
MAPLSHPCLLPGSPISFSSMSESWHPLLAGAEAEQALAIAHEIAAAVSRGEGAPPAEFSPWRVESWRHALSTGHAGHSLLHGYLYLHGAGEAHADRAIEHLDRAAGFMASTRTVESLYYGFPGIAWVTSHLSGRLFETDPEDGAEIDEALLQFMLHPSRKSQYDLLHGLVGLGVYAIERLPRPSAARCLESVVTLLAERAVHSPEGAAFFTPPEEILPAYRSSYPNGAYNLGVAHGLPGVVAILGGACHAGVATREARPLLDACVSWLLAREQPGASDFRFSSYHAPDVEPTPSRLAWCYGDLGIAMALLVAARGAGEPAWEREAHRIALAAARRDPSRSRVSDAGICHGAAGVAHLFNRLHQSTGDAELGETARFWLRRAFALRRPQFGVAGFACRGVDEGDEERWIPEPGFLMGSTGIALALLAAASSVPPAWDRLLLASLPG